ncbi:mitochondrial import inner membrane translocase subunit Tim13 [Drosophila guanche]|uniref:mitochondrial import inner membrane translocase subunit Tim13 n=1 Tax=Drosophila guanche TaxID=7266 RepID=UPI00147090A7|nr:mitochondrial import inner membrane translocase subunit Tim13 [Drosophila guanche]
MEPKRKQPDPTSQMKRVRQQIQLANVQELIQKMTQRCFRTCIVRPGPNLSASERTCLTNCADLFMLAVKRVSQQYFRRMQRQQQQRRLARLQQCQGKACQASPNFV